MKNTIYKGLTTLNEYLSACTFPSKYVEGTPSNGQFTYIPATKSIRLKADGTESYFWSIVTPNLGVGDMIEVEVEFANLSTNANDDKGKIVIVNTENVSDYTQYLSQNSNSHFKQMTIKHLFQTDGIFKISFGISNGATGDIEIRGVKVKIHTDNNTQIDTVTYQLKSEQRKCVIEGNAAFGSKFVARSDYSTDTVSISVGVDGLICTWGTPLESEKRPFPTLTEDYAGNSIKYKARAGAVTKTGFVIKFIDATTNAVVNIADMDLSSSIYIYFKSEV